MPIRSGQSEDDHRKLRAVVSQTQTQGETTMLATGISASAILPKKNPVPQRHPAVAKASMGTALMCRLNI